jgi:hypothetical protein
VDGPIVPGVVPDVGLIESQFPPEGVLTVALAVQSIVPDPLLVTWMPGTTSGVAPVGS